MILVHVCLYFPVGETRTSRIVYVCSFLFEKLGHLETGVCCGLINCTKVRLFSCTIVVRVESSKMYCLDLC